MYIESGGGGFDCWLRFSDLLVVEAHHSIRQAREEGVGLPRLPAPHTVPLVGKLFDSRGAAQARGLDIQLYLHAMLAVGGGVRTTVVDILRERRVEPAEEAV
jgi:hypothetical protein